MRAPAFVLMLGMTGCWTSHPRATTRSDSGRLDAGAGDARLRPDALRVDAPRRPFVLRDGEFRAEDWMPSIGVAPSCSTDFDRFLEGNRPLSEPAPTRGDPPSGWRLRPAPIANSRERCAQWVMALSRTTDIVPERLCHYSISIRHHAESGQRWLNGVRDIPLPEGPSRVDAVVAWGSVEARGRHVEGVDFSSGAWASGRWEIALAALAAAGIAPGSEVQFGIAVGNSTNVDQAGLGYVVDNTIDELEVIRFVDPNADGTCEDATPG